MFVEKNKRVIICGFFLFLSLLFFRNWLLDCISDTVVLGTWEKTVDLKLKTGSIYKQNFICRGELEKLTFYLSNCKGNSGKMKVTVLDHKGRSVKGCEMQNIVFSDKRSSELEFSFELQEKLKLGCNYAIIWECTEIGKESQPLFKAVPNRAIFQSLKVNGETQDYRIYVTYDYRKAISIKKLIVFSCIILLLFGILCFRCKLEIKNQLWMEEGVAIFASAVGYLVIELASGNLRYLSAKGIFLNMIPLYLMLNLVWLITRSVKPAAISLLMLSFLVGTVNHYILLFKGNPVLPWELSGIKTAVSVSSNYEYEGSVQIFASFVIVWIAIKLICILIGTGIWKLETRFMHFAKVSVGCVLYMIIVTPCIQVDIWESSEAYARQGFTASFIAYAGYAQQMKYEEPEGYSEQHYRNLIQSVEPVDTEENQQAKNIIVIMNESFADFRSFENNEYSCDAMPFLDSLRENTVYGNLYVPVFGGVTANTEFEFLTGVSCAYTKSIPYEMYVKQNMDSLAVFLKGEGFQTFAFHPYDAVNWNRNEVYPKLGFDQFYTIKDMEHPEYLRWCVSDASDYDFLIDHYEKHKGKNYFMFNVTMQNHGGYGGEYKDLEFIDGLDGFADYPLAKTYLSCIKQSDIAIEKFISYFSKVDEPTVVCFFGDHQPVVEDSFYEHLLGKSMLELTPEESLKRYVTPFYIWANYDIQEKYVSRISANYLMALLLKTAGYSLEGYEAFLYRLSLDFPVISMYGVTDAQGNSAAFSEDTCSQRLKDYEMLQYGRVMGLSGLAR